MLPVLMFALFGQERFRRLHERGTDAILILEPDLKRVSHGPSVSIGYEYKSAPRGEAPYDEIYDAFTASGNRVRRDFLAVCPDLAQHTKLGSWFRL